MCQSHCQDGVLFLFLKANLFIIGSSNMTLHDWPNPLTCLGSRPALREEGEERALHHEVVVHHACEGSRLSASLAFLKESLQVLVG